MPRKIKRPEDAPRTGPSALARALADELRSERAFGQPLIDEEHFKTNAVRVSVLWDRWEKSPRQARSEAIIDAYRMAEGDEFARRISLAGGMTIPEAQASGMLPWRVIAALREDDLATPEQCHEAMISEGASTLLNPDDPLLLFATEEEAEACRKRLADRLPSSKPCWVVIPESRLGDDQSWDFSD